MKKVIKTILRRIYLKLYHIFYRFVKTDDHIIMFISFHGRSASDSPYYVYKYLSEHEEYKDYKLIWTLKRARMKDIPHALVVPYFSIKYFYYLSKAKYWVINCRMPVYIRKKSNQIYLQTWHGTPLKKIGIDVVDGQKTYLKQGMTYKQMCDAYINDASKYDYLVSPNPFSTDVFTSCFAIDQSHIHETGYPRNDFIVNTQGDDLVKIKEKYGLPDDKKIVLYAPTWRDNTIDERGYVFELEANFQKWKEMLGEEYIVLFKPHYLIVNNVVEDESLNGFIYSIDPDADINELYVISDVLVTDYSSVFFDFSILKRPVYFYMYDLDIYKDQLRGFYLDIYKDLPGKVYEDENEMLEDIASHTFDDSRLNTFYDRFCALEDGQSSKRVTELLLTGQFKKV